MLDPTPRATFPERYEADHQLQKQLSEITGSLFCFEDQCKMLDT
jgi:hypothetical protein